MEGLMKNPAILLIVFAVLVVSGCGGSSSGQALSEEAPVASDNLPPDPGDAGKATVEGVDSDSDGVRDDLQRFIAAEYPDSERQRAAATQIVVALQDQLLSAGNKEQAMLAAARTMRAVECMASLDEDMQVGMAMVQNLQAEAMNTQLRLDAYRLFDEQVWGEVIPSMPLDQQTASCTFDPSLLAN